MCSDRGMERKEITDAKEYGMLSENSLTITLRCVTHFFVIVFGPGVLLLVSVCNIIVLQHL
jgi:hypothetical protein